MVILLPSLEAA